MPFLERSHSRSRLMVLSVGLLGLLVLASGATSMQTHVDLAPPPLMDVWLDPPLVGWADVAYCSYVIEQEERIDPADQVQAMVLDSQEVPGQRRYLIAPRRK